MPSNDHKRLMRILNKMAAAEQWRKMPKKKGTIKNISQTKTGNIRITFDDNSRVYVLRQNNNLFETAQSLKKGDAISIAARTYLGKRYCTRILRKR